MYAIGIDVGGMSIKGAIVDEKGSIINSGSIETPVEKEPLEVIADLADFIKSLLKKSDIKMPEIKGIGIGIPGTVNDKNGEVIYANNIRWEHVPLRAELQKYLDVKVEVNNDANCAALGEVKFGEATNYKDAVLITLGTGVGTGIILDNKIFAGRGGAGAEGGHMVINPKGVLCTCGRRGCWESFASATALIRETSKAINANPETAMKKYVKAEGKVSGRTAFLALKDGDEAAKKVVDEYITNVALGIVNLVNIFCPEVVFIGGGVSNEKENFIDRLQEYVDRYKYGGDRNPKVTILKASLKNNAGVIGAASLIL